MIKYEEIKTLVNQKVNNFRIASICQEVLNDWLIDNFSFLDLLKEPELKYSLDKNTLTLDIHGIVGAWGLEADNIQNVLSTNKDKIKGIILNINSPGGSASEQDEITEVLNNFKQENKVPIVAYINKLGASAGYGIATTADKIIASKGARVGSIGSMMNIQNISKQLEKEGIKIHSFKSGKYKNAGNPYEPLSEELENKFQEMVNESADIFFNQVSKARNIDKEKIKNLEGDIFNTKKALELNLIDEIGKINLANDYLNNSLNSQLNNSLNNHSNYQSIASINNHVNLKIENTEISASMNEQIQNELSELKAWKAQIEEKNQSMSSELEQAKQELLKVKSGLVSQYIGNYFKASGGKEVSEPIKDLISKASISEIQALIEHIEPCIKERYSNIQNKEVPISIQNEIAENEKALSTDKEQEEVSKDLENAFLNSFKTSISARSRFSKIGGEL